MAEKLEEAISAVLANGEQLKAAGAGGNEANTRALLIEPLLAALGWNLLDIGEVEREFRVYDGTYLDYALRLNGKPRLFVEAKALTKGLLDKPFVAQTVNYANNEGVLWCVLTNGLQYRVYKSNEPVAMDRKLLFEIDLQEAADEAQRSGVIQGLKALSRASVEAGELDQWGEQVFADVRVRAALTKLAKEPTPSFTKAIAAALEGPPLQPNRLPSSLSRVLGAETAGTANEPLVGAPPPTSTKKSLPPPHKAKRRRGTSTITSRTSLP